MRPPSLARSAYYWHQRRGQTQTALHMQLTCKRKKCGSRNTFLRAAQKTFMSSSLSSSSATSDGAFWPSWFFLPYLNHGHVCACVFASRMREQHLQRTTTPPQRRANMRACMMFALSIKLVCVCAACYLHNAGQVIGVVLTGLPLLLR